MTGVTKGNGALVKQRARRTDAAVFDPKRTKRIVDQANHVIDHAKAIKHWPLLEGAVDAKINEQMDFVSWWGDNVTPRLHNTKVVAGRALLSVEAAEKLYEITKEQVSKWRHRLRDVEKYRAALIGPVYRKAMGAGDVDTDEHHRTQGTGENEWYTPIEYIEAAREVMGGIDLDPATSPDAQERIKAGSFFTRDDDGLRRDWHGRVWLNPPFAQPAIHHFAQKMADEVKAGHVSQAIMLTHNYTDTAWFHIAESA